MQESLILQVYYRLVQFLEFVRYLFFDQLSFLFRLRFNYFTFKVQLDSESWLEQSNQVLLSSDQNHDFILAGYFVVQITLCMLMREGKLKLKQEVVLE